MALQFNPFTGTFDVTTKGDTGNVSAAGDGTAAAPGISFASEAGLGIYRPGAGQLALSTNGNGRLFISSAGLVGVGTSAPGALLSLAGSSAYTVGNSGRATQGLDINATAGGSGLFGGALSFGVGGTGRASISAVQGTTDNDVVGLTFNIHNSGTATADAVEAMRIDGSSGRLLVGTSSGSHTLTVNGTSQIGASQQGTTSVGSVSSGVATTILTTSTPASGTKVIEVLVSAVAGTGNSVITARFLWQVNGQGGVNTRNVLRESITTSSDLNAGNRTYTNLTAAATTSGANEILQVTATHGGAIGFTSTLNVVYRTVLGSDYS